MTEEGRHQRERRGSGTTATAATRALLAALAVSTGLPGVWATLDPRSFYADFPGPGAGSWVAALPPFNDHLTTDVGAFFLAFTILFAWAAVWPERGLVLPLAAAWTSFSILHLLFHVTHLGGLTVGDAVAQTVTLVLVLAAGAALVWLATERS
jgi:hypothetical protein